LNGPDTNLVEVGSIRGIGRRIDWQHNPGRVDTTGGVVLVSTKFGIVTETHQRRKGQFERCGQVVKEFHIVDKVGRTLQLHKRDVFLLINDPILGYTRVAFQQGIETKTGIHKAAGRESRVLR
jgi:hypothetical protein